MKSFSIVALIACVLLALTFFWGNHQNAGLNSGDLSFIAFNSKGDDNFSIKTHIDIYPNTNIQFTDAEWDGQKFGLDESNIIWNSGEKTIKAGTIINFSKKGKKAHVSIGKVNNSIKISKKMDAIFAYVGTKREPQLFLAAMATHKLGYGTLKNTGLVEGITAITFGNEEEASSSYENNDVALVLNERDNGLFD